MPQPHTDATHTMPSPLFALFGTWLVRSPPFGTTEPSVFAGLSAFPTKVAAARTALLASFILSAVLLALTDRQLIAVVRRTRILIAFSLITAVGMLCGSLPAFGFPPILMVVGALLRGTVSCLTAAAILITCPLASCAACCQPTENLTPRPRPRLQPIPPTPLHVTAFMAVNAAYGFLFGFMENHFSTLGNGSLYAAFGLVAICRLLAFIASGRIGTAVNLSTAFRVYALAASLLVFCAIPIPATEEWLPFLVAGAWSVQIFFTFVIFLDSEYTLSRNHWQVGGFALACAGAGMLAAAVLAPATGTETLTDPALPITLVVSIAFLSVVFLSGSESLANNWGFTSLIHPESHEAFLERRCGDLVSNCQLTPRELEILRLLARNLDQNAISEMLVIAPLTVKTHVRNIYRKLDVQTRQELHNLIEQNGE